MGNLGLKSMTEMTNSPEVLNNRFEMAEEKISEPGGKSKEIIHSKEQSVFFTTEEM